MIAGLEWYKWFSIIGVPSLISLATNLILVGQRVRILMKAQQADMRHQLLQDYHEFKDRGFITDDEQEDWEARYQAYHKLGKNGVLDAKRREVLALPNKAKMPEI